jgi:K+-sensing histidine kinase KdpD
VRPWIRSTLLVLVSVGVATLITFPFRYATVHNLGLFLIAAVMLSARFGGLTAGIGSALVASFSFDWFFDQNPYHIDLDSGALIRALSFFGFAILVSSIERQRRHTRLSLEKSNRELQAALAEVKTLRGILPICSYCKQIRAEDGRWIQIERYIHQHTDANFSHGMCPECYKKQFPDIYARLHSNVEKSRAP